MAVRAIQLLAVVAVAANLAACGDPTKGDLIDKARQAKTKSELQQVLGKPAEVDKIGPVEKWTYKASDGLVVFVITGDTVALQTTVDAPNKN